MSQPMHLRARPTPSSLLDDWSSLSTLAMPVLAPVTPDTPGHCRPRLISTLIAKLRPAAAA